MDYGKLGLKVGLEIHQELATEHKLFCKCPPTLFKEKPEYTFLRRLRPSQSELGKVDPAALFEFIKGKTMLYEADRATSCFVEMDEEPPGPLNLEALDICLTFALMSGSKPVDEVHVMRKIVVDGSNTTGFQRTCIISAGGSVESDGKTYSIQHVGLEEDAARKVADDGKVSHYRIDRLGIPLIEVATDPDIYSPEEAERVALAIGQILRATGKVRRGLGSIRQDVNISIADGAIIEIKGVQELSLISKVVEFEVQRQVALLRLTDALAVRGVKKGDLKNNIVDVTSLFKGSKSHILKTVLKKGGKVLAVKLHGFAEIVGHELCPGRRLGTEMADHARFHAGVRGIFHTDELPGYNISEGEVQSLRDRMMAKSSDAVVIVADEEKKAHKALEAVLDRAKQTLYGIPRETRSANPDGTSYFTRPRPGAARMYPETDIVCIPITSEKLETLEARLPEMPEDKLARLKADYGINEKLAKQVMNSIYSEFFEALAGKGLGDPTLIAVTLTETLRSLQRDGIPIKSLREHTIMGIFTLVNKRGTAKESIPELIAWLALNPDRTVKEALKALSLGMIGMEALRERVMAKVSENEGLVEQRGMKAIGPLMGMMMVEIRGRARAEDVQTILREAIQARIK
ncbi:Glu-tRNA(Gln) amidotransferase GatDE subunit E [Candidatus Bathyarchaeota archaeon]|jgi:glutamyl-tRNA(Gln) amidotransferase subunit E|nr:Glu-tRNA(Gln) amidotransferase GatDE subunit E [Candidatus Bathyarchaeota archaeon]MDP6049013.1 Glu-tRNA(Gln) amidotransferase subunit GatE [Candidatus Bathyarchaeota archaeon]MDP7207186.1 Glu-tRNA(Gln) amidotransferase subunit GatE [Candidatus Bathyarchaeota archaeon]MDP7443725.1 Glu-tRNA(Gln) amidotransferase subunit GatE [Candidatus Bathyarchaeota archaeon]